MSGIGKYVLGAVIIAAAVHFAIILATPRVLMGVAMNRIGAAGVNTWHISERVTADSRTIVRPAPDFAYSACPYDLGPGPLAIHVAPWNAYWSLSLYDENSDNFFTLNDREARDGGEVALVHGRADDVEAALVVRSPTRRGIALIRRLAPTPEAYAAARQVAAADTCATLRR